jgi:uncharacterized membrane protein (UPF0127 family)
MKNKWFFISVCMSVFLSLCAHADEPVVYSRDVVRILPTAAIEEPVVTDKKADSDKKEEIEKKTPASRVIKEIEVNIRPEQFLKQPGVFNLQPFTDVAGLLILLDEPRNDALQPNNIYAAVDVLFLAPDGKILQIAPSITPSDLEEAISSNTPSFALLFIGSGQSEKQDIRPGDMAEHTMFKTKPTVLTQ